MPLEENATDTKDGADQRRIHLREICGDSDSPLETVGQDLRAARLRRGDEIASVSRALKIRKDHLDSLEEDRLEDLPGKTYAIGFVRSYARHLGLDSGALVERYKQEISGRTEEQPPPVAPIHQDEQRRLPQGWRLIAGVVLVLLLFGIWHLLFSGGDTNQPVPPAPVLTPPKTVVHPAPKPPLIIPAQSATPSPATDNVAAAPNATGPNSTGQASVATPPPAAGSKLPETQIAAPGAQKAAAVPAVSTGHVYGAKNRNPRVILRARSDTSITVRGADGSLYINRDLKAGDVYQVPNLPGLYLATSNGGAVEVDLDGVSMGRAGQSQQILGRVSLDPQSLVDRLNTH